LFFLTGYRRPIYRGCRDIRCLREPAPPSNGTDGV
jgi:hypothetical protein